MKSLDRIAQNPLVEESISSNPAWDRFSTPLLVIRPVSLQRDLLGVTSQTLITVWNRYSGLYADMFDTVLGLRIKSQHRLSRQCDSRDAQASPSDTATRSLPPLLSSHSQGQICTPHLLIILTKHACHHNSFWGSRCDNNHASTISLKPRTPSKRFRHFFSAYDTSLIKAQFITN